MGALAYPGRGATRRQLDRKPRLPNDLHAMNETDTPETDAAECDCSEFYDIGVIPGQDSGPSGYVHIEAARKMERERDTARLELSKFAAIQAEQVAKRAEFLETLDRKVASREREDESARD